MIFKNILTVLLMLSMLLTQGAEQLSELKDSRVNTSKVSHKKEALSDEEKNLARLWLLSDMDWDKYKTLMKGPRGIWSPGLDPITALGVSETNESERRRYAEIWMKVETRKVELELAFEVERMAAAKRLHGDKKLVNNDDWIAAWSKKHSEIKTKVSLFVDADCIEGCKDFFAQLKGSLGTNAVLDIYFADGATSQSAGAWASEMNIDPKVVQSRVITLNFDKGTSDMMGIDRLTLPQIRVLDVQTGKVTETFIR